MIRLFVCLSGDFLQNRMWRLSELCKEVKKPSNLKSDFFFFFFKKNFFLGVLGPRAPRKPWESSYAHEKSTCGIFLIFCFWLKMLFGENSCLSFFANRGQNGSHVSFYGESKFDIFSFFTWSYSIIKTSNYFKQSCCCVWVVSLKYVFSCFEFVEIFIKITPLIMKIVCGTRNFWKYFYLVFNSLL